MAQAAQAPPGVSVLGDVHELFGRDTWEGEPAENRGWTGLTLKDSSSWEGPMLEPLDCSLREEGNKKQ